MRKNFLFIAILILNSFCTNAQYSTKPITQDSSKPITQDSIMPIKCFPFGTSLWNAYINDDGSRLALVDVYYYRKVFDLRTGKMIAFASEDDAAKVVNPLMKSAVPIKADPYKIQVSGVTENNKYFPVVKVIDSLNNVVFEMKDISTSNCVFNAKNGDLIVGVDQSITLFSPGKKGKKIGKAKKMGAYKYPDTNKYVDDAKFSPNCRYIVSKYGYITDIQKATTIKNVFSIKGNSKSIWIRPTDITFNAQSTTCTVSLHDIGLVTYDLASGAALDTVAIPAALINPILADIFEIIQIPETKDFIYWLRFMNKAAAGGIAYYIKDGMPLNICDPGWIVEQTANRNKLIDQFIERQKQENAAALKLQKEQDAYNKANANSQQENSNYIVKKKWVQKTCGYCDGKGEISYEKLIIGGNAVTSYTIDQYGTKTYKTTGKIETKTCTACKGKRYVEVYE